jgi:hypothetical protein
LNGGVERRLYWDSHTVVIDNLFECSINHCVKLRAEARPSSESVNAPSAKAGKYVVPKLDVGRIGEWMDDESYDNKGLAAALNISPRAVSSLRNGGKNHGARALAKLANLMKCEVEDLYLG